MYYDVQLTFRNKKKKLNSNIDQKVQLEQSET